MVAKLVTSAPSRAPKCVWTADAWNEYGDGSIFVFSSPSDVQKYIGRHLASKERALLREGGVLRTRAPDVATLRLDVESDDPHIVTVPALTLGDVDPSHRSRGGYMLAEAAAEDAIPLSQETLVYTGVTPGELALAERAPATLGFDDSWSSSATTPAARYARCARTSPVCWRSGSGALGWWAFSPCRSPT
ncbi:hypothetical protein QT381_05280 [Galbitalea sp. SE-J8]|uniref:hypothetical protein n=1 Tax=Galbitalea sp. SE-J8 TaxID=3054952 RepID=UPI00259CBDC1|nr:hypothetical protein [Galbitalea sp. SE-J8]MDM4762416.1 hypothetical protein [Galbitalea sp. SE-J8]